MRFMVLLQRETASNVAYSKGLDCCASRQVRSELHSNQVYDQYEKIRVEENDAIEGI
jgi:hypothetical protein